MNQRTKGGFLGILLGTLDASLLGDLLTGKSKIRADEGTVRSGFLMQPYPFTKFEIQKYFQNDAQVSSKN